MRALPAPAADALLVGADTGDDAAVWRLDERTALVFTTDFFTPIVDDPFDWGRIAAANALSDVYAMGGRPVLALNLVGWPREALPLDALARVLEGGAAVARDAGVVVAGGHTIDDPEPKYGMAVLGIADPDRVITNAAAKPGDRLILTKPIGTGIVATAIKRGDAPKTAIDEAVAVMTTLNDAGAAAMLDAGVVAATDVTGFGLLGHLHTMLLASGVAAVVSAPAVPVLGAARELAAAGAIAGGTRRNRSFLDERVDWGSCDEIDRMLLSDAQTSGGLLICTPEGAVDALIAGLGSRGVSHAEIGVVEAGEPGRIALRKAVE